MPNFPSLQGSQSSQTPALPARPGAAAGTQSATEARDAIREAVRGTIQSVTQQGEPVVLVPPRRNEIPPEVIPLVGMSLSMVVAIVVGYPIARAIARVIERRGEAGIVRASDVVPQLRQLQASVDTMAIELERMGEAQRFTAKLMTERSASLPSGESRP